MAVILDGKAMTDRAVAHTILAEALHLPEYYGRNLDALYDILTDIAEDTELIFRNPAAVETELGRYGTALLETLREAAEQNPYLTVTLE